VKKSNSAISGSGSPGLNIHVLIDGKEYLTQIDADGKFAVEGIDLSSVSKITAYASDSKYISPSYDLMS
jgi:predicted  nucleic acid-binding Zn-ribbon protein